ncbi:leucine-rich repeat domain-containing protein [Fulvivirga sediminis]|uniref:Leucine-rich repeat protein n=1 Tax=Fulvivirga sediminis TaxID=2803949 RepID=A0A937K2B8_9BACT|nr:leucine-rich repeat domain-containing protein [Fulvivirga sediminis]MBL3658421.1 leucine-rich repeat protein [Fulvivirga sediminis]
MKTNFEEAKSRIKLCRSKNSKSLNLSGLGLNPGELIDLMPSIKKASSLEKLDLSKNEIFALPDEIGGLGDLKLKSLNLSDNGLTYIPSGIKNLKRLESLDVSKNSLENVPKEMVRLPKLEELYISGNKLKEIPAGISKLENLKKLKARDNLITTIPNEITLLSNLKDLGLGDNHISSFPSSIGNLTKLKVLDLDSNGINELPSSFRKLVNLEHLYLMENNLKEISEDIGRFTKLEYLDLGKNELSALPEGMKNLTRLQTLDISDNEIERIPSRIIRGLTNLETLMASGNALETLSADIGRLTKLKELYLSENALVALPEEIGRLSKLKSLYVNHNELTELPEQIKGLTNLKKADFSFNELTYLPPQIGKCTNLEMLNMTNNSLTAIPEHIGFCKKLKQLSFYNNKIEVLPPQIGLLTKVKELMLSDNRLTNLPLQLTLLKNLNVLSLGGNSIPTEQINALRTHFQQDPIVLSNLMATEENKDHRGILATIFKENSDHLYDRIQSLDLGTFKDAHGSDISTKEVIFSFLEGVPVLSKGPNLFIAPAKEVLNELLSPDRSSDALKDLLQQIAVTEGDCSTPIKSFLIQKAVSMQQRNPDAFPQFDLMITREAVEATINQKLGGLLTSDSEKIEQVQALANSIFLKGAEKNESNMILIKGERERLPSKTENLEYGFELVNRDLADEFAKVFCKTGADGKALKRDGSYFLDPEKLIESKEAYYANSLGIVTERERRVNNFAGAMQEALMEHDHLLSCFDKPDVLEFLDANRLKDGIRNALRGVEDSKVENEFNKYLAQKQSQVATLAEKYKETPDQQPTASTSTASRDVPDLQRMGDSRVERRSDMREGQPEERRHRSERHGGHSERRRHHSERHEGATESRTHHSERHGERSERRVRRSDREDGTSRSHVRRH